MEIRNESPKEIRLLPLVVTVWGEKAGRQEIRFFTKESGINPKVKVETSINSLDLLNLAIGESGVSLKMGAYETSTWPPLGSGDATKIRWVVGPEGSKEQEIFTVTR